jgi:Protein of unknown function (DUF3088)
MKDRLYLLRPGFMNAGIGPLYCNDSAPVEGMLGFFPKLRELLDVQYVEFARPRVPLIEALGSEHQSLPVLIVAAGRKLKAGTPKPETARGRLFFANERAVRDYLSVQYGFPQAS